jgi:ribonuclease HI
MRPWLYPDELVEDTAHLTTSPWTQSPIKVDIAVITKTDTAIAHAQILLYLQQNPHNIIVYTDGSQLANNTGMGYCIPMGLPRPVRAIVPMGATTEVFDAELRAIYKALLTYQTHICRGCLHRCNIHIFTDNQSAITRASNLDRGPGQETAYNSHGLALALQTYAAAITIHWVLGYTNIMGNEDTDTLAKLATTSPPTTQLPISLSWLRRKVREQHTADWTAWYATCPKPKSYSAPHRHRLDAAYTTLPRKLSSAILRLRTGHGYFLACLAHPPTEKYPSRNCTCPLHPPQMPKHLLLSCPEYHIH